MEKSWRVLQTPGKTLELGPLSQNGTAHLPPLQHPLSTAHNMRTSLNRQTMVTLNFLVKVVESQARCRVLPKLLGWEQTHASLTHSSTFPPERLELFQKAWAYILNLHPRWFVPTPFCALWPHPHGLRVSFAFLCAQKPILNGAIQQIARPFRHH